MTVGKAAVTDVFADDKERLLKIAAAAEADSAHPLAQAVVAYGAENGITVAGRAEKSEYISGKGLKCLINGENILLGQRCAPCRGRR